jgi:hypothetical protein
MTVDADLASAAQLLDRALGEARKVPAEPAIQPDIRLVRRDYAGSNGHVFPVMVVLGPDLRAPLVGARSRER